MQNKICAICSATTDTIGFIQVKFAVPREESPLHDYKGYFYRYRYLCGTCALAVNHIVQQFPKIEVKK